jgi:lysophospholipase L1-like esterase
VTIIEHEGRSGVLAFGDSITNGGGELQWGVALQSWALWVARGLGLPYTGYAVDGARAGDLVGAQIPLHRVVDAHADARYALGCLYIGVNDVRAFDWDAASFERDLATAVEYLAERCQRVLCVTIPCDLGRPRAGSKVLEANAVIERVAGATGALILDLGAFGARNLLMADHVHPTAFGQLFIAERALDVLEAAGMRVAVRPSTRISYETTRWRRFRGDFTYAYRHAKTTARELRVRLAAVRAR